jgi:hypothetical protein
VSLVLLQKLKCFELLRVNRRGMGLRFGFGIDKVPPNHCNYPQYTYNSHQKLATGHTFTKRTCVVNMFKFSEKINISDLFFNSSGLILKKIGSLKAIT